MYLSFYILLQDIYDFVMFNDLRWEVIVRFIDIGEAVDHHTLNYLFNENIL